MNLLPILKQIPMLRDLDEKYQQQIAESVVLEYFSEGYCIFNEGDVGEALYIIKQGSVRIYKTNPDGTQKELAILKENQFFGEMALLSDSPRNASAVTTEDTLIFMLTKEVFFKLINENSEMAEKITNEYVNRMRVNRKK